MVAEVCNGNMEAIAVLCAAAAHGILGSCGGNESITAYAGA